MTGSLGRVTGRESGRVGGVGTVQENEGFGSHPAVTTKPSFSLHASRVTRLKGGCAPKIPEIYKVVWLKPGGKAKGEI